ncbi:unnamed protein product [Cuscuta epithymum]|uniref:Uncharacterized protein n=1 Tax=Cuscuta epithymum TaxID=186058 RepID=A0AAV0EI75_9ASTE|nr:unnamed protein product [Cuscuta epithymum]
MSNPRRNIFHNLFLEPQMRRAHEHVNIPTQRPPGPDVIVIPSPTRPEAAQGVDPNIVTTRQIPARPTDPMFVILDQLKQRQDKINGILGVPPPLDLASHTCYASSSFFRQITDI